MPTDLSGHVVVLSIDYRRALEHPAAVDDAQAAFRWAHEHAADLGAIPGKVAVGGDSAGGNLAAVVALLARDDARTDAGSPIPVLQNDNCSPPTCSRPKSGRSSPTTNVLARNISAVGLAGAQLRRGAVAAVLAGGARSPVDLVLADPPYDVVAAAAEIDDLPGRLTAGGWAEPGTVAVPAVRRHPVGAGRPAGVAVGASVVTYERRGLPGFF